MFVAIKTLLKDEISATDLTDFALEHFNQHLKNKPDYDLKLHVGFHIIRENKDSFVGRHLLEKYGYFEVLDENYNSIFSDEVILPLFVDSTRFTTKINLTANQVKSDYKCGILDGIKYGNNVASGFYFHLVGIKEPLYITGSKNAFGVLDYNGKEIIPKKYSKFSVIPLTRENNKFSGNSLIIARTSVNLTSLYDVYDCKGNLLYEKLTEIEPLEETVSYKKDFLYGDYIPQTKKLKTLRICRWNEEKNKTDTFELGTENLSAPPKLGFPYPLKPADFKKGAEVLLEPVFISHLQYFLKKLADTYEKEVNYSKKELILRMPIWKKINFVTKPIPNFSLDMPVRKFYDISFGLRRYLRLCKVEKILDFMAYDPYELDGFPSDNLVLTEEYELLQERVNFNIRLQNSGSAE